MSDTVTPAPLLEGYRNGYNVLDKYKALTLDQLQKKALSDRLNYSLMLLNVDYDINISNCIRSAHLFGCKKIYIVGKNRHVDTRGAVGSQNYIEIEKYVIYDNTFNDPKSLWFKNIVSCNNYQPLAIEQSNFAKPITKLKKRQTQNSLIVMGNENTGIPYSILQHCLDVNFYIPQLGVIRSLNVASACAIACWTVNQLQTKKGWF